MAYTRQYPLNITPDGDSVEDAITKLDEEFGGIIGNINDTGVLQLFGTKRQSVLTGLVDSSGNPNFLTASGLQVSIDGSSKPIYLAFANGFNDKGTIDLLDKISSVVSSAWTLPANQTLYLYVDKDISTGILSYGYSSLIDLYQSYAPSSPTLDQHWFNTAEMKMYRWNGSAWEIKQRVFVAKGVTGASTITLSIYPFGSQIPLQNNGKTVSTIDQLPKPISYKNLKITNATSVSFTGNTTSASNSITSVSSTTGLLVGMTVFGAAIPAGTTITAIGTNTLTLSANAASSGTTSSLAAGYGNSRLTITADAVAVMNSNLPALTLSSISLTIDTSIVASSTGGGLDTGTLTASRWYDIYVAYNPTTQSKCGLMVLYGNNPVLPSGYTFVSQKIGSVRIDASKYLMRIKKVNNECQYVVTPNTNTSHMPLLASGALGTPSTGVYVAVSVSDIVPDSAEGIDIIGNVPNGNGGNSLVMVAPNESYGTRDSSVNPPPIVVFPYTSLTSFSVYKRIILESSNIYYAGLANSYVYCSGWKESA